MYWAAILAGMIWGTSVFFNVVVGKVMLGPFDLILTGIPLVMCIVSLVLPLRVQEKYKTRTNILLGIAGFTLGTAFLFISFYRTLFIVAVVQ
jgi:hypothetical protein